ncbi:N-alpha-acetyltransferase 38, NatC auxiliary subunit [Lobulomyces angularis]|nr:N-alpha-acetyltransferase 38, NatC auxiliary subunit [Lobulomyces angularis]
MNQRTKVYITDGRTFEGLLMCTDRDCNLILSGTMEVKDGIERHIGLTMIPGKHITEVLSDADESNYA